MFDIGGGEFILLVILGLLVFGPRRLPALGRQLGGYVGQMRRAMNDFKGTLEREVALEEVKEAAREVTGIGTDAQAMTRELFDAVGPPPPADPTRRLRAEKGAVARTGGSTSEEDAASEEDQAPPEDAEGSAEGRREPPTARDDT